MLIDTAAPAVPQRPWATVAPFPEPPDRARVGVHYAAMAWAYMLSYRAALSAGSALERMDDRVAAVREANTRYGNPLSAAFSTAALLYGVDLDDVVEIAGDADATEEALYTWLLEAHVNPAEIAPAP